MLADMAVLSVLKMIAQIYNSKELQFYNESPAMNKRIPGYKVKLGFGLHLGWAIEGMIGSNFKADASYLSPNVNKSARLETSTKFYGTQFLMTESV
jgi:class 3 adenylate cyclase